MKTKFKFGVKQIVLLIVAIVLIVAMIVGNIVLDANSITLHKFFGGDKYNSEAGGEAYEMGDAMVSQLMEDSVVLFRNENNALPLDATNEKENKVNLFGWNATTNGFLLSGTGSGGAPVLNQNRVTIAEAFEEAGYEYNKDLYDAYASAGSGNINLIGVNNTGNVMQTIHNPGQSFYTEARMQAAKEYSDVAIVVFSRNTGENCGVNETINPSNYSSGAWLELTANEKIMLENIKQYFGDGKGKVIVLINTTNTMELGFLEEYDIDAAMFIGSPGQSGARAIPHLLYGQKKVQGEGGSEEIVKLSPSGKTADTYAYNYNLVNGKVYNPTWASTIQTGNSLYYQEGIYLGYKWYETADKEGFFDEAGGYDEIVQYPFGYGLSYTTFKWIIEEWPTKTDLTEKGEYEVKVRVANVGDHPGKDVVELYYTPPYINGEIEKAEINLLAFGKTVTLQPGETQVLTLKFNAYDLASYDDYDKNQNGFFGYELDGGDYFIKLMTDAHHPATCYASLESEETISNSFKMTCSGVEFATDPVTGEEVKNLFTKTAETEPWDGTPLDGSTVYTGNNKFEYLSRKDQFANFPNKTTYICNTRNGSVNQTYQTTVWNNADTSDIQYGQDAGLYLLTKEDGSQASSSELGSSDAKLEYNVDLMTTLWDYDAEEWDIFLDQLTKADVNNLIAKGKFQTVALTSVGKPFCNEYDGPTGFNQNSSGVTSNPKWVVFPTEITLGCSWNPQSTYNMGKAMGFIGGETGVHGWYGPGLNLHRSPYYARNYEYFSEDGVLAGKLAAECIKGAKENNLTCYMKHYVCADTGQNSGNWTTWLTEQNLRENYLRPFEIAVKEGGANGIMSGFSAVGSMWAGANWALSTQILRNEWGFRGSMITDWADGNAYMNHTRGILAGNDLWLGQADASFNLNNKAEEYCARQSAKNILYTYVDCYMTAKTYQDKVASGEYDDPYAVNIDKPLIGQAAYSHLFVALWAIANILLILGLAVCALFFFVSPKQIANLFKGKKATAGGGAVPDDGSLYPMPDQTPAEPTDSTPKE